jgi:hypothetical protein
MDELGVFQNALIYTVVSSSVSVFVTNDDDSNLVLVILIFSVVVYAVYKTTLYLGGPAFPAAIGVDAAHPVVAFVVFVAKTTLNLTLQFQSQFVAILARQSLRPETSSPMWVVTLASFGIMLLWLLTKSIH